MEKVIVVVLAGVGLIFAMPILGVLAGMFSGWVISLVFPDIVVDFLRRMGMDTAGLTLWHVGGAMGFFGGFLKTSINTATKG